MLYTVVTLQAVNMHGGRRSLAESKSSPFEPGQNSNCSPGSIWPPCPSCHPYESSRRPVIWAWWLTAVCRCPTTSPQSVEAVTTNCDNFGRLSGARRKTPRRRRSRPLLSVAWTTATRCATASPTNWRAACSQFRTLPPGSWRAPGDAIISRLCSASCTGFLCSSFGDRTFAAAGPQVWNNLPPNLRLCGLSYSQFRRLLKTFLFG